MEHDAARGLQTAHAGDELPSVLNTDSSGDCIFLRTGAPDVPRCRLFEIPLQFVDELVEPALLIDTRRFPYELRAIEIGLRREAPGALDECAESLARDDVVDPGGLEFAFEPGPGVLL